LVKAETANEKLVEQFIDCLNREALDDLRPILHPDATWKPMTTSDIPGAGGHHGHKGIIDEFLRPVRGLFEGKDPQNEIHSLFSKGDMVAAETHGTGKLKNGKIYDNRYAWLIQIKDGKIFQIREYMDTAFIQTIVD
jgi:uncharacterized protein